MLQRRRVFTKISPIFLLLIAFFGVCVAHSHSHSHGGHGHAHAHSSGGHAHAHAHSDDGHGHAHAHHHEEEPVSFKYSQHANVKVEKVVPEEHHHDHHDHHHDDGAGFKYSQEANVKHVKPVSETPDEQDQDDQDVEGDYSLLDDLVEPNEETVMGSPEEIEKMMKEAEEEEKEAQSHEHEHSHDHAHSHSRGRTDSHEKKQAKANKHSHDHHGHSHDHHGHSHDHHGHSHDHHGHSHEKPQKPHTPNPTPQTGTIPETKPKKSSQPKQDQFMLWVTALGSTAMISCAPVLILLVIPLDNTSEKQPLLRVLLSFASGGLLGDAFLHLIPHALVPHVAEDEQGHTHSHSHEHGHSHGEGGHHHNMFVGLWVLGGIVAFLCIEKFVRYVKGDSHSHSHGHSHGGHKKNDDSDKEETKEKSKEEDKDGVKQRKKTDSKNTDEKKIEKSSDNEESGEIAVAGYLNLAADFSHNFTDGLAIGASYLVGHSLGVVTTITILLHEVPHEIGDFAILVQSGCSKRKAMLLQFSTAFGAMAGTVCSLLAQGAGEAATAWILPFTAGGFIYIATVSVIPELLVESKPWQTFKEIVALLVGVYMMVLIAEYE